VLKVGKFLEPQYGHSLNKARALPQSGHCAVKDTLKTLEG